MRISLFLIVFFLLIMLSTTVAFACPVIVAVVDTGLDSQNPVIKKSLWVNRGEIPGNKIDDDGNGYIDDIHGWDFTSNSPWPEDRHGHGTHVTGIIISEIRKHRNEHDCEVLVMPLKYYDLRASTTNTLFNTISALRYAVTMGVHIINYSGGGPYPSESERRILQLAEKRGILMTAAAGNNGVDFENHKFFPAGYRLSNILSITATDGQRNILDSSNYGSSVDLAAEGKNILSWVTGTKLGTMTGTSQATAFVTAAAALILARQPFLAYQPQLVIKNLKTSANPELLDKTGSGFLNTKKSLFLYPSGVSALGISAMNTKDQNKTSNLLYIH